MTLRPEDQLRELAEMHGMDVQNSDFAKFMDEKDPLNHLRRKFAYPKCATLPGIDPAFCSLEEDSVYLCGNSLGLMPAKVPELIGKELQKWSERGVFGHETGDLPWAKCDDFAEAASARLVGADLDEVAVLNGLTVNLSLLLSAFYRPTKNRFKILMESHAFPSDHYLVASHIRYHGYDPFSAIVCVEPPKGELCLKHEDILEAIQREGDSIALILFSGVQFYTGQVFDMKAITEAGHRKGCIVGLDLAHAIGNVQLKLKEWKVDFAAWCSYKYLNSGAGGIAGIFFNKKWHDDFRSAGGEEPLRRFEGWWGNNYDIRFQMSNVRALIPGAGGFKLSNAPPLLVAPLLASLEIFESVNFNDLLKKQFLLTGYLEFLLKLHCPTRTAIITPADPTKRGNQLSVTFDVPVQLVKEQLEKRGVVCDVREPGVLRVAPAPLYNSFRDVFRFVEALKQILTDHDFAEKCTSLNLKHSE